MQINEKIARDLGVKTWQVEAAVKLIDEGNTISALSAGAEGKGHGEHR